MIHTCNFCEYQTPYVCNLRRHLTNKHVQPLTLHSCICRNCKFEKGYQLRLHMQNIHKFDDTQEAGTKEAGSQTDESMGPTFQKADTNTVLITKKYICPFCNFKTHKKYNLDMHKRNRHSAQEYPKDDIFQKGSVSLPMNQLMNQKEDVLKLIGEAFDVFQIYMKIKMQRTDFEIEEMIEEMIEECIDVSKYAMKQKISEQ